MVYNYNCHFLCVLLCCSRFVDRSFNYVFIKSNFLIHRFLLSNCILECDLYCPVLYNCRTLTLCQCLSSHQFISSVHVPNMLSWLVPCKQKCFSKPLKVLSLCQCLSSHRFISSVDVPNMLSGLVPCKQKCFSKRLKVLSVAFGIQGLRDFQADSPAMAKAQRPYVLSR